jgi:hypothetical protein
VCGLPRIVEKKMTNPYKELEELGVIYIFIPPED